MSRSLYIYSSLSFFIPTISSLSLFHCFWFLTRNASKFCFFYSFLSLVTLPATIFQLSISKIEATIANLHSLKQSMKQLIRRLSRVADSSQYSLLHSDSQTRRCSGSRSARRPQSFRCLVRPARRAGGGKPAPEGHVPVYVGDEMERFVVSAELLNHPIFIGLLNKSAQEYGYDQKGVLRIPCHVLVFERVMEALRLGLGSRDLEDLLGSLLTEDFL